MSFCNTNVWSIVFPIAYLRKLTIYSGRIANGIPVQKGEFGLAQETVDAIRQAEATAEAAEKEAVKETEAIVAEAKAQAAQMKAAVTESTRKSAVGVEEDVKAQSGQTMQAAGVKEGKDLEALQKAVAEKQ